EDQIHEAHDRHFVGKLGHLAGVFGGGGFGGFPGDVRIGTEFFEDVADAFAVFAVEARDEFVDCGRIADDDLDFLADDVGQFVDSVRVEGIGERDLQGGPVIGNGQTLVHPGGGGRDLLQQFRRVIHVRHGDD